MEYGITADSDNGVVRVEVVGDLTIESVTSLTKEVGVFAVGHGFDRFLFDMRRTTAKVSDLGAFDLAANPEKRGLKRGQKRAVVHAGDNDAYHFFENVSVNRGYTVRTFTDIEKALEWLKDG